MVEDSHTATSGDLLSRLAVDVSIATGVCAFAGFMWGINALSHLAKSAGIGIAFGVLMYGIIVYTRLAFRLIFPGNAQRVRVVQPSRTKQSRSKKSRGKKNRSRERTVDAKQPPQERKPVRTQSDSSNSVADLDPRTVSIAAAALPTPPFPKEWSVELIETLEWKVFDDVCVEFWEAQGNKVSEHVKGSSEAATFFISSKSQQSARIGVVQSRSSQANHASVIEMKNLLRMQEQSKLPIAMFMYAGRISNVVSSFCQSHGIRLIGSQSIYKGLSTLPHIKQRELMKELIKPDYMLPTCPNCQIKMVKRKRKDSGRIFWGCLSYPECRETIEYSPYF